MPAEEVKLSGLLGRKTAHGWYSGEAHLAWVPKGQGDIVQSLRQKDRVLHNTVFRGVILSFCGQSLFRSLSVLLCIGNYFFEEDV